jgi:hypothetical protein
VLRVRAPPHPNLTSPDSYDSANWSSHRATDPSVRWGCAMKRFFLILIAGFALVMAHDFNGVHAGDDSGGEGGGIPLSKLASKYAETFPGLFFTFVSSPTFPLPRIVSRRVPYLSRTLARRSRKKPRTRTETLVQTIRSLLRFLGLRRRSLQPCLYSTLLAK